MSDFDGEGFNKKGHHRVHFAASNGDARTVTLQLDKGVDVNIRTRNENKCTALMNSAYWGQEDSAKVLLERKADATIRASRGEWQGKTALDLAKEKKHDKVVAL